PNAARRSVNGFSPSGRLMTIPMAPSISCRTIKITARSKRVSRIAGVAIRSWPLSEGGGAASDGPIRAAVIARRARIKGRAAMRGMGRSLGVMRTANSAHNSSRRLLVHSSGQGEGLRKRGQELSEVLALEQAKESLGRIFEALDHVLAILEAAAAHPVAGVAQEIILFGREIPHDETAQREALAQ